MDKLFAWQKSNIALYTTISYAKGTMFELVKYLPGKVCFVLLSTRDNVILILVTFCFTCEIDFPSFKLDQDKSGM